jgi:hypothetical protein
VGNRVALGLALSLFFKPIEMIFESINVFFQPLILELCMIGNIRFRIFGVNLVFINPFLSRYVRLRLRRL